MGQDSLCHESNDSTTSALCRIDLEHRETRHRMRRWAAWASVLSAVLATALGCSVSMHATAPVSVGFGVSVPYDWPVDWTSSYSHVSLEFLLSRNLTVFADLGTYPTSFPDDFEGGASLLAKAWIGQTVLFAGGGLSMQAHRVGSAWSFRPCLALRMGYQVWLHESFALVLHFRTLDPLPVTWTLTPEISLGFAFGLGQVRPNAPQFDAATLWVLIGLGVAAMIAFLPRK